MYQPFQIVWATLEWMRCPDERPWLLIDVRQGGETYGGFPISTKTYENAGFYTILPADHADFSTSGLSAESYVYCDIIYEIGADEIRKPLGRLTRDLLDKVTQDAGL